MEYREIFEEMTAMFARAELSPRMNEELTEIYVNAPLGKVYEKADVFVRFTEDYYTVEAYIGTGEVKDENEMYRLMNMINLSSDECTFAFDTQGVCCRSTLYYEGAVAELVRLSIYHPMFLLDRFSSAIRAVAEGSKNSTDAIDMIFSQI